MRTTNTPGMGMGQPYYFDELNAVWVDYSTGAVVSYDPYWTPSGQGQTMVDVPWYVNLINIAGNFARSVTGAGYPKAPAGGSAGTIMGLSSTTLLLLGGAAVLYLSQRKK